MVSQHMLKFRLTSMILKKLWPFILGFLEFLKLEKFEFFSTFYQTYNFFSFPSEGGNFSLNLDAFSTN